jgi:predicted permease
MGAALARDYPDENRGRSIVVAPSRRLVGELAAPVMGFLALLMAIVGLVLMIACVNISGMLLARGAMRRREVAVRLAIGAGRGRLVGQLLTETTLLFALSGAAGVALAFWMRGALLALLPELPVPAHVDLALDWRVIAFATVVTCAAALLAGVAPALDLTRQQLAPVLRDNDATLPLRRLRLRSALVVGQVAMSLMLLLVAGLFMRTLQRVGEIDPGFDAANVEIAELNLALSNYTEDAGLRFADRLVERVSALPGVRSAALALQVPLGGGGFSLGGVIVEGRDTPDRFGYGADWNIVTPGYFGTMGITLVRGRGFDARDGAGAPGAAVINETMASRLWPGEDPIGKRFRDAPAPDGRVREIVGVVRDGKYRWLGEDPRNFIFVPLAQNYLPRTTIMVKTNGAPALPAVRALVHELDPTLPVLNAMTLDEYASVGLLPQRLAGAVSGILGVVALLLAAIGTYGVTAYSVARRTREIGIRVALGAQRRQVLGLMLRHGLALAAAGTIVGVGAALALTQLIAGLLYGVSSHDPVTFGAGAALLFVVATLASYLPARRALAVEPVDALRHS